MKPASLLRPLVGLLAAACLAPSCGREAASGWRPLVGGTRSGAPDSAFGGRVRAEADGRALWIDHELPAGRWTPGKLPDEWQTRRPDGMSFMKGLSEDLVLRVGERELRLRTDVSSPAGLAELAPGDFTALGDQLHLRLAPGETPAELAGSRPTVFSVRKARPPGERATLGGWTGEGFSLWPGERMAFDVTLEPGGALGFFWALEGIAREEGSSSRASLTLRVDGRELGREEGLATPAGTGRWCRFELGARSGRARLELELAGEPCLASVLAPVLEPGPEARRERAHARPGLVLFLADTFRADLIGPPGGEGVTPFLDRLAAASVRFPEARSNSTWTLPAQATMLSGLYPEQHGAVSMGHALPAGARTLAEQLAAAGYRTGAVTDSAFVSRHYGFDQGFEWFQENRSWNLVATLAAARDFLAADDGRPVFLFVQTYRTHAPYRTGVEEERGGLGALAAELRQSCRRFGGDGSLEESEAGRRMAALYQEGARALDAGLGSWWEEVRALAALDGGVLVFTSDHGEAFLEHGDLGHGGTPWEERTRIPLFFHGERLAPRAVPGPASLVDLPTTLARLAGVAPDASWQGRDLLGSAAPRAADYSFVRIGERPMVALVAGTRKLYAPAEAASLRAGEVVGAVDLARDPRELEDRSGEAWAAELARAQADAVERLTRAALDRTGVELSPEDRAFLDEIGYGGGE